MFTVTDFVSRCVERVAVMQHHLVGAAADVPHLGFKRLDATDPMRSRSDEIAR